MKIAIGIFLLLTAAARADVYLGELKTGKCTVSKGKDFTQYMRDAMGNTGLDVVYDDGGTCGKSVYITKKKGRKRWTAFADKAGCECFLKTSKVLENAK